MNMNRKSKKRGAFTLMEILLVVAMLALLLTLLVPNLGSIFTGGQSSVAKTFVMGSAETPLMSYKLAIGRYPTTEEGLQALVTSPNDSPRWKGPYLKQLPLDPWNNPYKYAFPGEHNKDSYDLWSVGPDGQDGTSDDIGNWEADAER